MKLYRDATGFGGTLIVGRLAVRWGSHVQAGLRRWTWYQSAPVEAEPKWYQQ